MQHPFKVGEHYRNRDGEYVVVSIEEPDMVIQYPDGRTIKSPIVLQSRIWANIQEDEEYGTSTDLTD